MKYSGMGIQMGIIILVGAFAGQKLDAHYQTSKPYFTVALSLFSTFAALYIVLKDFIKKDDDE
jgi:F0F1-type ATP synthase assembly protein I